MPETSPLLIGVLVALAVASLLLVPRTRTAYVIGGLYDTGPPACPTSGAIRRW